MGSAGRCIWHVPPRTRRASSVCRVSFALSDRFQPSLQSCLLLAARCNLVARAVSTAISTALATFGVTACAAAEFLHEVEITPVGRDCAGKVCYCIVML